MHDRITTRLDRLAASDEDVRLLATHVAIPSVSARPEHAADVRRSAEHVRDRLASIGFAAELWETAGHPTAYGEWRHPDEDAVPTLLIYGHHDVQPVEPLQEWKSQPFVATPRDGRLYGRGTTDDKGQVWCHLLALEAWLAETGKLPCTVKVLVEGEEEIGSAHFDDLVRAQAARLKADAVLVSDTPMLDPAHPSICYGLRGLTYAEIHVRGASHDLHSGGYGGALPNPATVLAEILATLHDKKGRVAIQGFYDTVRRPGARERKAIAALPFDEPAFLRGVDGKGLSGEQGWSTLERLWCRPTCDVMGIVGGYTGAGAKTILPASAMAKVSCRLVPDQEPEAILDLFEAHVRSVAPPGVAVEVRRLHGGRPWVADTRKPAFRAAAKALEASFGAPCVFIRAGGSIPFVRTIADALGAPCLLVGFGLPDENAHAPNEWLDLANYRKGQRACAALYETLARTLNRGRRG